MNDSKLRFANKISAVIVLILAAAAFAGCKDTSEAKLAVKNDKSVKIAKNNDQNKAAQVESRAKQLLTFYFGKNVTLQGVVNHSSGLVQITALTNSGSTKVYWMLPDQKHIIDGVLYSPNVTKSSITPNHSAVTTSLANLNTKQTNSKNEMRNILSSAISKGGTEEEIKNTTKAAIQTRIEKDVKAKRAHAAEIAKTITLHTSPRLETATLPRNNNIADKSTLFKEIEKSNFISSGISKKILYVFFDVNCDACKEVQKILMPYTNKDLLQVRYIPVGAIGPDSQIKATAILAQPNNETRLDLMNKFLHTKNGEELPDIKISEEQKQKGYIASLQNFKLLLDSKRVATPTFAYMTKNRPTISVLRSKNALHNAINSINN